MANPNTCVCFQVDGSDVVTLPASEWSRLLRYLWRNRYRWITVLEMISELNTSEVPARLSELEKRFGVPVDREPVPGSRKLRYRLGATVEVVKVEEVTQDG